MILLLKLEERSCKGCNVQNELSVLTDLSQKKHVTQTHWLAGARISLQKPFRDPWTLLAPIKYAQQMVR